MGDTNLRQVTPQTLAYANVVVKVAKTFNYELYDNLQLSVFFKWTINIGIIRMNTTTFFFRIDLGIEISHDTPLTGDQKHYITSTLQRMLDKSTYAWDLDDNVKELLDFSNEDGIKVVSTDFEARLNSTVEATNE